MSLRYLLTGTTKTSWDAVQKFQRKGIKSVDITIENLGCIPCDGDYKSHWRTHEDEYMGDVTRTTTMRLEYESKNESGERGLGDYRLPLRFRSHMTWLLNLASGKFFDETHRNQIIVLERHIKALEDNGIEVKVYERGEIKPTREFRMRICEA